jgi:hypothetical protein
MMMAITEISMETEQLLLLSRDGRKANEQTHLGSSIWCRWCCCHVKPISDDEAAILTRVCSRAIFRQFEAGLIHYMETSDGLQLLCPNSL